ncbi:c-type cytochrome [Pelagibacterium sp. H642]|uniref:c-type cytochrome n=1 Tax=Pelagibacterium sp. H642 TaxID=1881069 RepID=UPI0028164DDA|nr:c-type cytochrome [Pelagibacterium sp. H642]WMT90820.1 c-type cytochrome [Pelagibacterium sp. H642]
MPDKRDEGVEMVRALTRWQRLGLAVLFVVGVFAVGAGVFVWTGYYNISAKAQHWDITTEILETVRDQSIRARADTVDVPNLDDPDMIALGREHFLGGCSSCHGLPGEVLNPVISAMLPNPPDLTYAPEHYDAGALFWLIDNGIKYTGMPAWPADNRSDEVWPLVAYLIDLNRRQEESAVIADRSPDGQPTAEFGFQVLTQCSRCHGDAETPPVSALVPELAGQPVQYLERALREYRDGIRPSGYMLPAAYGLTDDDITELAEYYAGLPPRASQSSPDPDSIARGGQIAAQGVPADDVPACLSCHGNGNPQFPELAGQSARYLESQLELWRGGGRAQTGYGEIMSIVGQRMSPEQIRDVSAFFASLTPPEAEASQ